MHAKDLAIRAEDCATTAYPGITAEADPYGLEDPDWLSGLGVDALVMYSPSITVLGLPGPRGPLDSRHSWGGGCTWCWPIPGGGAQTLYGLAFVGLGVTATQ